MNENDIGNNSFGEFLSALRKSRGFTNISEYLRQYPLSISSVHYRQLESGNRNISIEAAKLLCKELQAEPKSFYYSLLKDWLPSSIMDFFVPLSEKETDAKLLYQQAIMRTFEAQTLYPNDECCNYLVQHFELMPILWLIYSRPTVSVVEIEKFALQHNVTTPARVIVDEFVRLGFIQLAEPHSSDVVQRVRPTISFAHHRLGQLILEKETKQFQGIFDQPDISARKDSLMFYSLMSISPEARQTMFRRIQEFVRDVRSSAEQTYLSGQSGKCDSEPVFYSIVFAPRPQYRAQPVADKSVADQSVED